MEHRNLESDSTMSLKSASRKVIHQTETEQSTVTQNRTSAIVGSDIENVVFLRIMSRLPVHVRKIVERELNLTKTNATTSKTKLTKRENEVLMLVANGYSRNEISDALSISPNTVARHIANVYSKLEISTIAEATSYAIYSGLITLKHF